MEDKEQKDEQKPGGENKPPVPKKPTPEVPAAPPSPQVPGSEVAPSSPQAETPAGDSELKKLVEEQQKKLDAQDEKINQLVNKDAQRDFDGLCNKHGVKDGELFEFLLGKKPKDKDVSTYVAELKKQRPDLFNQAPLSTTTAGDTPGIDKDKVASLEAELQKAKEAKDTAKMLEITTAIQALKK